MIDREAGSDLPLPQQLRFDAGSPALNLLATRGYRRSAQPVERLTAAARLEDWLAGAGLPPVRVSADGLRRVRELREAAYLVLAARLDAQPGPGPELGPELGAAVRPSTDLAAAVDVLDGWTSRPLPGPRLRLVPPAGRAAALHWSPAPDSLDTVLTRLARDLAELAAGSDARLRRCASEGCGMLYLDRSPGQRRRWCSMSRCGNSAKVAAHRARRAGS